MAEKIRGFEKVSYLEDVQLPIRATKFSAGYDLFAQEDIIIPGMLKVIEEIEKTVMYLEEMMSTVAESKEDEKFVEKLNNFSELNKKMSKEHNIFTLQKATKEIKDLYTEIRDSALFDINLSYYEEIKQIEKYLKPTLVPTGVKAYMQEDEFLALYNRSSNPIKKNLFVSNGVGVIDQDYYNNEDNEGHIQVQFLNMSNLDLKIKKGERIAQGIFQKFLLSDNDNILNEKRAGGHGSTY